MYLKDGVQRPSIESATKDAYKPVRRSLNRISHAISVVVLSEKRSDCVLCEIDDDGIWWIQLMVNC